MCSQVLSWVHAYVCVCAHMVELHFPQSGVYITFRSVIYLPAAEHA